jgi:hypothetical protein
MRDHFSTPRPEKKTDQGKNHRFSQPFRPKNPDTSNSFFALFAPFVLLN